MKFIQFTFNENEGYSGITIPQIMHKSYLTMNQCDKSQTIKYIDKIFMKLIEVI